MLLNIMEHVDMNNLNYAHINNVKMVIMDRPCAFLQGEIPENFFLCNTVDGNRLVYKDMCIDAVEELTN